MANQTFFMVVLHGGGSPTYMHSSIESAEEEAKRLTKKTGQKSYVLCSIKAIELNEFKVSDLRPDNELPF